MSDGRWQALRHLDAASVPDEGTVRLRHGGGGATGASSLALAGAR